MVQSKASTVRGPISATLRNPGAVADNTRRDLRCESGQPRGGAGVSRHLGVRALRWLRGSQPFNRVATDALHAAGRLFGTPEMAIRHLHRMGSVRSRLPNGRVLQLWSQGDDWVSNQVFWRGWAGYEPETTSVFFRLALESTATIDVGAYVGYFSLLAAHANPAARVLALEPLPTVFSRLVRNVRLNRLSVECLMAAAGDREGSASFYHQAHDLPTSSSLSREFMADATGVVASTVRVVRIDDLVRERRIGRVDLVKIDTESTEPAVLAGMAETLSRDRPSIVCEVLRGRGAEDRLAPLLAPFGYRYFLLTPDGPQARERIEGHPRWLNYLFVARTDGYPGS